MTLNMLSACDVCIHQCSAILFICNLKPNQWVHQFTKDEYEIFIASGTNIKYMETTYNKDWQTYINRNSTKAKD